MLRRWGSSIQKFGFINGVSPSSERIRSDEGLTLETSAFRISVRWPIYIINSVDKTKFLYTRGVVNYILGGIGVYQRQIFKTVAHT